MITVTAIQKRKNEIKQNNELMAWGLILLVFIIAISNFSNSSPTGSTALGFNSSALSGSPEIGE